MGNNFDIFKNLEEIESAQDIFYGRSAEFDEFIEYYKTMESSADKTSKIITLDGIGGVGKTEFIDQVCSWLKSYNEEENGFYVKLDFRSVIGSSTDLIIELAKRISKIGKCSFPLLGLALIKIHKFDADDLPEDLFNEENTMNKLVNSRGVACVLDLVENMTPIGPFVSALHKWIETEDGISPIDKLEKSYLNLLDDGDDKKIAQIISRFDLKKLREIVPSLFIVDLKNIIKKRKHPLTIILDTYEHYISKNQLTNFSKLMSKQDWLTDDKQGLINSIDGIIWIISGRDDLSKDPLSEGPSLWNAMGAKEKTLKVFSKDESIDYLQACGIEDESLIEYFYELSDGLPLTLHECYKIYHQLENDPTKDKYNKDNYGKSIDEAIEKYWELMPIEMRSLMGELSLIEGYWTDSMIELLKDKFSCYNELYYKQICNLDSVSYDAQSGKYFMNSTVRHVLSSTVKADKKREIYLELSNMFLIQNAVDIQYYDTFEDTVLFLTYSELLGKNDFTIFNWLYPSFIHLLESFRFEEFKSILDFYENCNSFKNDPELRIGVLDLMHRYYSLMGDAKKSTEIYESLMSLENSTSGNSHIMVWTNLSEKALAENNYEDAMKYANLYLDAATKKKNVGAIVAARLMISYIYTQTGLWSENIVFARETYNMAFRSQEVNNEWKLKALDVYCSTLSYCGKYEELRDLASQGYEMALELKGPEDMLTISFQEKQAEVLYRYQNYDESIEEYQDILRKYNSKFKNENSVILRIMFSLARSYSDKGDTKNALKYIEHVYDGQLKIYGPDNTETLKTLNTRAICHEKAGDFEGGLSMAYDVLNRRRQLLDPNSGLIQTSLNTIAAMYKRAGMYEQSWEKYYECYEIRRNIDPVGSAVENSLARLNTLANIAGNKEWIFKSTFEIYEFYKKLKGKFEDETISSLSNAIYAGFEVFHNYRNEIVAEYNEKVATGNMGEEEIDLYRVKLICTDFNICMYFESRHEWAKLYPLCEELMKFSKEVFRINDLYWVRATSFTIEYLANAGRTEEALECLEQQFATVRGMEGTQKDVLDFIRQIHQDILAGVFSR